MNSDFARRVYRNRRLVFALLAVVVASLALRLALLADPASHALAAASLALVAAQAVGSLALLLNTRAWVIRGTRMLHR